MTSLFAALEANAADSTPMTRRSVAEQTRTLFAKDGPALIDSYRLGADIVALAYAASRDGALAASLGSSTYQEMMQAFLKQANNPKSLYPAAFYRKVIGQ